VKKTLFQIFDILPDIVNVACRSHNVRL